MTAVVCKRGTCGHPKSFHAMEAADKQCCQCTSPPFCYDFMPEEGQLLESAKQKTQSSYDNSQQEFTTQPTSLQKGPRSRQPKSSNVKREKGKGKGKTKNKDVNVGDEQKFANLFAAATEKIDKLTSDANQKKEGINDNLKKSIRKVIRDLASDLKAQGFPISRIAGEIVRQLSPKRASRSWILEVLPDEYKNKVRQESARKRKKVTSVVKQSEDNLPREMEFAPPAEQKPKVKVAVDTDGHEVVDTDNQDSLPEEIDQDSLTDPTTKADPNIASAVTALGISPRSQSRDTSSQDSVTDSLDDSLTTTTQSKMKMISIRILVDWDELSTKIAELRHKDIKNFWLCGRVDKNGKLTDMMLEQNIPGPRGVGKVKV